MRRMNQPKTLLLRRAIKPCLEELADARAVKMARIQGGKPVPWDAVKLAAKMRSREIR
jgi:hypothetical protein